MRASRLAAAALVAWLCGCTPPPQYGTKYDEDLARTCARPAEGPVTFEHADACMRVTELHQVCGAKDPTRGDVEFRGDSTWEGETCYDRSSLYHEPPEYPARAVAVMEAYCRAAGAPNDPPEARRARHLSCLAAGRAHRDGAGVPKDPTRAAALFDRGCAIESGACCHLAGLMAGKPELIVRGCELRTREGADSYEGFGGPCNDSHVPASMHGKPRPVADGPSTTTVVTSPASSDPIVPPTVRGNGFDERCARAIEEHHEGCVAGCDRLGPGNVLACKSQCESVRDGRDLERRRGYPVDLGDDRRCRR